jgi:hypothetical protein
MVICRILRPLIFILMSLVVAGCGMTAVHQSSSDSYGNDNRECQCGGEGDSSIFATNQEIKEIQARLILLGYPAGEIDGVAGQTTRNAIRAYQADHKLLTDGRPSSELLMHIRESAGGNRADQQR